MFLFGIINFVISSILCKTGQIPSELKYIHVIFMEYQDVYVNTGQKT